VLLNNYFSIIPIAQDSHAYPYSNLFFTIIRNIVD